MVQVMNGVLYDLAKSYSQLSRDPQYSETLRELKKYNSKYLQATQAIKNFEALKKDLSGGNELQDIPVALIKSIKAALSSKENPEESGSIRRVLYVFELAETVNNLGLDFEQQKDKFNEGICFREMTKSCLYRQSGDNAGDTVTNRDI